MASVSSYFSGPEELEDASHAGSLLKELKLFYDSKLLVDVTIEVESSELYHHTAPENGSTGLTGKLFPCNRNILAAASPYFRSMFTGGLYESKQKKVTIHDVDAESMSLIIDYCYTGKVTVTEANVQRLYAAANMLQLEYVRQACSNFMTRRLDLSNCAGMLKFADTFDNHDLKAKAQVFIARNFQHFWKKGKELCELSLGQIKDVLSTDTLDVDSERKVCSVAVQWIEASESEDGESALELLKCVRWQLFTELDKAYIDGLKSKPFAKKHCLEFLEAVTAAGSSEVSESVEEPSERLGMSAREMILFFGHPKEPFLCYDPYTGDIFSMVSPLTGLALNKSVDTFSVCISPENDLYLASQHSKNFWVYNGVLNSWQELAERLLGRVHMDIGYLNGHVYVVGGRDPLTDARLKEVECYSVQRNQWVFVAPVPHSLGKIKIVTVNDHLYVVSNRRMLCYDAEKNEWLNCAALKRSEFHKACVYQDEIFCICDIPVVKVYSPARGEWRRIGDIPLDGNTHNYQVVQYDNKLMLITTTIPHRNKNSITIHEYDPTRDLWENMGTMLGSLNYALSYGFICLSARIYPSRLESGQNFFTEEDDDCSGSSADWDFDGLSDADSESGSSSSFSDENW
ncbi:KBTB7 protein, partial [Atractosteus spatula]|nr:KBTB7 protein [Atractosteus spatula]